jgi:hypothetical protein
MTQKQAAKILVEKVFSELCYEMPAFTSEDVREACMKLIDEELEKTQFITEIVGE